LLIELKLKFVIERLYLFVFISSFVELKESIIEQFVIFLLLLLFIKKVLLLDNKVFEAFIVEGSFSYSQAKADAAKRGYRLVMIKSAKDQEVVNAILASYATSEEYWFGLYGGHADFDDNGFVWTDGTRLKDTKYTNWASGEPNNAGGSEPYGEMYSNGRWNDESETTPHGYIAEKISDNSRGKKKIKVFDHKEYKVGHPHTEYEKYMDPEPTIADTTDEMTGLIHVFARMAITQETRAKLYHYGNDRYMN
jgi:hypothetical protein